MINTMITATIVLLFTTGQLFLLQKELVTQVQQQVLVSKQVLNRD
jgi:hypothetical protein